MRRRAERFGIAAALLGLAALVSCGGGGNSSNPPPKPPPTTNSGAVLIYPGTANVPAGQKVQFLAFLPSAPTATFTWSIGGSANGSIDSSTGVYTAPNSVPNPANVTVTATASGGASQTGTATVNISAPQGLVVGAEVVVGGTVQLNQVGPSVLVLPAGGTQKFNATAGGLHQMPTWQVSGNTGGDPVHGTITVDPLTGDGVYSAPLTPPPSGSAVITALSGSSSGTASVTVVFSNASLTGRYAFSYTGTDSSGPLAVAGSFIANAVTGTLSGLEDYNSASLSTPAQAVAISGPFSVNPDGSGTATVTPSGASPPFTTAATWQFTMIANPQGGAAPHALLLRFDTSATGSGTIDRQNPTQLLLSAISGNYAFSLSGVDGNKKALQICGKFNADGFGTIPTNRAVEDINDAGSSTSSGADKTLHGTYAMDAASPGSGRGTVELISTSTIFPQTLDFTFYIVDGSHLKIVETDTNAFLSGDFLGAPNTNGTFSTSILKGTYAFTLGGTDLSNHVPYSFGGMLTASGSGSFSNGISDENDGGLSITLNKTLTASGYTVDSGLGRISFSFTTTTTSVSYAGYTTSSGSVLLIRLDSKIVAGGIALPQSSTVAIQGSYALNGSGALNSSGSPEEDALGQMNATGGAQAPSGSLSVNDAGKLAATAALSNSSAIDSPTSNGRGTATIATSSTALPVVYYIVDRNTVLTMGSNATRISEGVLLRQF